MTVAVLFGLLGGYGLVRVVRAALGIPVPSIVPRSVRLREVAVRVGVALGAAAVAAGLTSWPAAAPLAAAAAVALPRLYAGWRQEQRRKAQVPAIATWVEMLRDALAAAAGIETAIRATAGANDGPQPPAAIAAEVRTLVARIDGGWASLEDALRAFADDVDDPDADMAIAALILAINHQAGKLVEQLTAIATTMREGLNGRERIATGVDRGRWQAVILVGFLTLGLVFEAVYSRTYLSAYGTAQGQVVLGVAGGLFLIGGVWLMRMARPFRPPRLLTPLDVDEVVDAPPAVHGTGATA